jgi:hypothetical protein
LIADRRFRIADWLKAVIIRLYTPTDRMAVERIAADTAFFGAPVEAFLDDRRVFIDGMCTYYIEFEPEHLWVAATEAGSVPAGTVAGYLFGCVDTTPHSRIWTRRILPRLILRTLTGHYRLGRKTWRYSLAALGAARRGQFPGADLARYPAHLHINMDARFRGEGGGRGLMEAYLGQLSALGVRGVHLHTTSGGGRHVHTVRLRAARCGAHADVGGPRGAYSGKSGVRQGT